METVQLLCIVSLVFFVHVYITRPVTCTIPLAVTSKNVYAREGDTLTLNCSVIYSEHTSYFLLPAWSIRPPNGKSIDEVWVAINGTSINDCCDVTGDKSKGESNLVIKRVTKESSGQWFCVHPKLKFTTSTIIVIDSDDPACTAVSGMSQYNKVVENTEVILRCSLKTENITPPGRLVWYRNGAEIHSGNSPLDIRTTVTRDDHGVPFSCRFEHSSSFSSISCLNSITPVVQYDPKVETLPVQRVKQGDGTILQCDAKAAPDVDKYQWITPSGFMVNGRTLTLQNVHISDNGIYNCTARNTFCDEIGGYGHGSNYTYLDVLYPSKEVFLTGNSVQKTDESLTLTCTTSRSNPASTITWYKNGSALQGHPGVINITTITEESSGHTGFITKEQIHIKSQPDDNAANIRCSANNPYFSYANHVLAKEIILSILFPPNQPENCRTQLTKTTPRNELVVNSRLTLQCTSCSSNPPSDISWYMDGIEVKSSHQTEHRPGQLNGTVSEENLQIKLTYKHNKVSIHCVAINRNFAGQLYRSQKKQLDVQYAPFPANELYNRRAAVNVGENAMLTCQMNGNPPPSIQWYDQHGSQLQPVDNIGYDREDITNTIQESTLYIEDVDNSDYGRYYCRGENKHGDVEIVIILSGKSAPDAVSDIEMSVMADIVTVQWKAGYNGGDDQNFYVEYVNLPEGVKKKTEVINDNELGHISVNISGLVEGSSYYITVVSLNSYGEKRSRTLTIRAEERTYESHTQHRIFLPIIISCCALILAGIFVGVVYVIRRRSKANLRHMRSNHSYESINDEHRCHSASDSHNDRTQEPGNFERIPLRNIITRDEESDSASDDEQTSDAYTDLDVRRKSQTYMKPGNFVFEFPRDRLHITETLRTSTFHRSDKALAWFIDGKDGPSDVAIKTEIESSDPEIRSNMLQEIKLMKKIHSEENVIKMLGYCTEDGPILLIIEYASYGNLKNYLEDNRERLTPGKHESARRKTLAFATDVASGMKHLQRNKIIHRYLAAKHVLVCEGGVCKISNFSYASGVMSDETFFEANKKIPYQWMAPESLMHKKFTLKTDVWSFGVVLWEIFSLGRYPYKNTPHSDLLQLLGKGHRMIRPDSCEDSVYEMMLSCWKWSPGLRQSVQSILQELKNISGHREAYLTCSTHAAKKPSASK